MLKVDSIENGIVLDHIKAGKAMEIYHQLNLDHVSSSVAIIKNVKSQVMGLKDIIKINDVFDLNLDLLGYIDTNITVNIIKDNKILEKKKLDLPNEIHSIIKCKNPRCITSIEQELEHIFTLADKEKGIYRCYYCEEKAAK
ncbi:aspartate carbamoyltransferase regulatory subunit [Lachnotalea glycerini]|uniref:Aspartate carbamoyltransferase regulatory subunit n=1 Tax=Lachnotalea glycerini TaxID=1763509 RepID=A0A255I470_9FIRM|nr:aspartate carbamoyltransferase regulatory subunit [Lachnotalea glycerini]OYO84456.1 aspartate carbamoyltransferase regulatory subunit [Lachnotalea glycerini]PXV93658.1 aspartate carbamoyltransferase regulatory subunit [Lachnotalea glycerini]RDY32604.1 aspartate carbamoyltransferase regulatory subunit [Lachnotalea glycerini]